jgi:hypothetical protein
MLALPEHRQIKGQWQHAVALLLTDGVVVISPDRLSLRYSMMLSSILRNDSLRHGRNGRASGMIKKRRVYQPRVFDGRVITSDEIERIHKEVLEFERTEAVSDPMRELIEDLWPELTHKLPPKRPHS